MAQHTDLVRLRPRREAPDGRETESLIEELGREIRGEVRFDRGSRGLYCRDASNFRMMPIGVVIPRGADDVVATVEACRRRGVPLLPRGGGTSLAGQCVNTAVVMDFTKYMGRVLEIDPERKLARVEAGAILDRVRQEASEHGLTVGPDPATHDHCTIGGMIGNDACGVHAIMAELYGPGPRMQDNVHDLEVLTYDGTRMRVGATSDHEREVIERQGGRRAEIYRRLRALRDRYEGPIRERFPDIPRRVSGYSLPCLLPEQGFQVARALSGTEGTCVTMLDATVHLVPSFPCRALLVLGFEDVARAGDVIPEIRALEDKPIGCEGLDRNLIEDIRNEGLHAEFLPLLPEGDAFLIVHFGAFTHEEALHKTHRALRRLGGEAVDHRVFTDAEHREAIWEVRESGLGATAFVPHAHDTRPGFEDSAVPPAAVGPYLRELRRLLREYGYGRAALYGHFAQGCVHTRIPFDLGSEEGLRRTRAFTRQAAHLCVRMGGSLSGEHGDGQQRGELLSIVFGPELVRAFRELKDIWDPDGKMNPGKVFDALPRSANLALGTGHEPWEPKTRFPFPHDHGRISHAARRCVGVGKCRRLDHGSGVMCPSFMVLHEERHTTRGRAHLFFEMLQGDVVTDRWRSEEVKDALDLCLACKGCVHDCPVHVDIPTLKAEFLSHYYEGRLRPRHAYAFGLIHRWARLGALVPELTNLVTQTPGLREIVKWAAGMHPERQVPRFAPQTFRSWWKDNAPADVGGRRVMLWPDTFNNHFFPDTLAAAADVLVHEGCEVVIPHRVLCCGRPLYDYGMLRTAKSLWERILSELEAEIRAGTPLVGIEPSCTAAFRDELRNLYPDDDLARRLSAQTYTLPELLRSHVPGWRPPRLPGEKAIVHFHCHHQSVMGEADDASLLESMGIDYEQPQSTCCGMAGSFGFERDHYDLSQSVGELALLPAVRRAPDDTMILADGFSCRTQVLEATGRRPLHVAEVLQLARHTEHRRLLPEYRQAVLRPDALERGHVSRGAKVLIGASLVAVGGLLAYRLLRDRAGQAG